MSSKAEVVRRSEIKVFYRRAARDACCASVDRRDMSFNVMVKRDEGGYAAIIHEMLI